MWPFTRARTTGQRGERLAARLLRRKGCKVLARNYRCPPGEADIVVLDPSTRADSGRETIAFVEVKTRSSASGALPESAVDRRKQAKLIRVARYYLAHHGAVDYPIRFDVIAVLLGPEGKPQLRHIVNAFEPR
ncbi:hypothetical protein LCGC14_1992100 [marine sediment metagenome]|uniref:Uncharacterized protein n=1 Tax=marine sediment metagenome TaxID=412755 RepID=A0A0F9HJ53_9ZZZZ